MPPHAPLTRASSAASHQSGTIKEHWNDLPPSMVTPPLRSLASTPLPAETDDDDFPTLLETLFSHTPTTLQDREKRLLHEKVVKCLPSITPAQRSEVAEILRRLVRERSMGVKEAKEAVVAFIMRERGVAGWAGCVRRGVECVVLEGVVG